jgi:uncharacterized protein
MRFAQDSTSSRNLIRSYGRGEIKVNDQVYRGPLIVAPSLVSAGPSVTGAEELLPAHAAPLIALAPEIVLLGTGARQVFPSVEFGAAFLQAGVGFEVMDTGAACRTFNVLIAEERRVVALLLH